METLEQFRAWVESAFRQSGLRHTRFGFIVANDPNLITELHRREFRTATREKIAARIKASGLAPAKPKRRRAAA